MSTAQLHQVMEAFRTAPSNSELGTKFEQLMVRYFELDPALAARYDSVCRWVNWPHRGNTSDVGIDLVARDRDTGEWTAIQCKFYEPLRILLKSDLDSFFTASGKTWDGQRFVSRIIISTTDKWSSNAENAIEDQIIPVARIGLEQMAEAPIDWSFAAKQDELTFDLTRSERYDPLPHQVTAIEKIRTGFATHDRGQWISACGTGKTFTSLRLAEELAEDTATKALRVLFLAPSIQLVSQTLREWTAQTRHQLHPQVVCSDTKAARVIEDISPTDVLLPATTDPAELARRLKLSTGAGLHVVFSTYQSLSVVAAAQQQTGQEFDLILCDEAHRTTGHTLAGTDESHFTKVHNNSYISAAKRLYMTATPRVYGEAASQKAAENSVVLTSMDNEDLFGPVFHTYSFGDAVSDGRLTDYKVLVLAVSGDAIAEDLQAQMTTDDRELQLDDATRIVGCWNGLAKLRGATIDGDTFPPDATPMKRAVAFLQTINKSKQLTETFPRVVEMCEGTTTDRDRLDCDVRHVDGTMNALQRGHDLAWLKAPVPDGECRILSNARCLSEGVDVPALDAVMFLNPRSSVVDVVQAVGRVMRRSPGKDYGYIILPVAIPAGIPAHQALDDNKRFKVVWQVLNALRSHDTRFDAIINSIALNKDAAPGERGDGTIMVDILTGDEESPAADPAKQAEVQPLLFNVAEWRDAVFSKIVTKVGDRQYWENWAKTIADVATNLTARIEAAAGPANPTAAEAFHTFLDGLRANLNESITAADAASMLAQHIITKPIFEALFEDYSFATHNPVSIVMEDMLGSLAGAGLEAETADMTDFYRSVEINAANLTSAAGKQKMISDLYGQFFKHAFPRQSEALGVVYTPVPIVDFIVRATDQACRQEFGYGLTDEGVHVLDPFTGTGTFMVRLLQSGIIRPEDLARKYAGELWANEVMLLAYYIACVNIEATYHGTDPALTYQPFPGSTFTDTFQSSEEGDRVDTSLFPLNNDRIEAQLHAPIRVILGNPPYSVGQDSANDNNANLIYPTLRRRIGETYAAQTTAKNARSLYDSYIGAFRWATDRIGDHGIVAFVTNNGFLEGNAAAGVRLSMAHEFSHIWIFNLRGNQRASNWRVEGAKVFDSGSQAGICITVALKNPAHTGPCIIEYTATPDAATAEAKLDLLNASDLDTITWETVTPNEAGDWFNHRSDDFATHPALADEPLSYFHSHSRGVETTRDAWCYNFSAQAVADNMRRMIDTYNHQARTNNGTRESLTNDPTQISWSSSLIPKAIAGRTFDFDPDNLTTVSYRPFTKEALYFDNIFNHRIGQNRAYFPTPHHDNLGFYAVAPGSQKPFSAVMSVTPIDLAYWGSSSGKFYPRWTYHRVLGDNALVDAGADEWGYRRADNVTDEIQRVIGTAVKSSVSKDDIFFYVYGVLHSSEYRTRYAGDLKKLPPRVPLPAGKDQFDAFSAAGRALSQLHQNYEAVEPFPLDEVWASSVPDDLFQRYGVTTKKMAFAKNDPSTLVVNPYLKLAGIPAEVHEYLLGGRSALGWVMDRYRVTTDGKSQIVNDANDWAREHDTPTYIVDLIKQVVRVSVETLRIVNALPPLPTAK